MTTSSTLGLNTTTIPNTADLFVGEAGREIARLRQIPGRSRSAERSDHVPASEIFAAVVGYASLHSDAQSERDGYVGVVPSCRELLEHLSAAGFAKEDIAASGLSRAISAAAGPIAEVDCLHTPGLPGRRDALYFRARGKSNGLWRAVECGPVCRTDASDLVIVGDPAEAAALRNAGLSQAYCVANLAAVTPEFWEGLASAGVERVVLLSCARNDEWEDHLQAASAARDADSTPAIRLHELPEACGRSCADEVRRDGARRFAARLFADVSPQTSAAPSPVIPDSAFGFDAATYWAAIRPELDRMVEPLQRRAHERLAVEVCGLLEAGRAEAAEALLSGDRHALSRLPSSTSHHVENIRSSAAGPALARRLFDLLRCTGSKVTVASPLSREAFIDRAAAEAVGHGGEPFANRTLEQLRDELHLLGDRLRVVTTPQPHTMDSAQAGLFAGSDVILLDLTTRETAFWWQQNGWCGRMTELAEEADADLVAFWPAAAPRKSPSPLRSEFVGRLRSWVRSV